jgi:tetratricopeptide (TPR) repeat protein
MRIRTITLAAGLVAAVASYTIMQSEWFETPQRPIKAKFAVEDWPICTTMGSLASGDWAGLDPDFAAGKVAMIKGQWASAIEALKLAALRDPRNPDIQNYIGYAYRRIGLPKLALAHFQQAIEFNARHRGAHQHLGEAYLSLGELARAEQQLAALEGVCLIPCTEYGDLKQAIATYKQQLASREVRPAMGHYSAGR